MKRKAIWLGILTLLLAAALTVTALAAEGWNIHVSPINILVDGEVFQPKDVTGNSVSVFCYNGTTYAPLRALAEAYGLEVGYDAATHTATVDHPGSVIREPDPTARDFSYQWRIEKAAQIGGEVICKATYAGPLNDADFQKWWDSFSADAIQVHTTKLAEWAKTVYPDSRITMYFVHGDDNLGTACAE